MTVNAASGHKTLAARFLGAFLGAGYQHVALSTADIFKTAGELRRGGLPILPIPGNYYDDLQARFDLETEFVSELRSGDILYDEDQAGRPFFQLYSRAFDKRFFFEVVQRGDYHGYGAPNAQTRLAAQARYRLDEQF